MTSSPNKALGIVDLFQRHMDRLEQQRGGFGPWRSKLFDLSPRWQWLSQMHFEQKVPTAPYPIVRFVDDHDRRGWRLVHDCLKPFSDVGLDELLQFVLHRLGHGGHKVLPSSIRADHMEHWEAAFDLATSVSLDRDLFGDYLAESMGKLKRDGTGFFATPMSVSMMIAEMTLTRADRFSTVTDPCVGTGRLLLAASNFSLCLYGQDINQTAIRATLVNMALFAPQVWFPPPAKLRLQKSRKVVIPRDTVMRLSAELKEVGHGGTAPRIQFPLRA